MTLDLDELERIAKAATPGRWSWNRPWEKDSSSSHYDGAVGCLEPGVLWFGTDGEENIYCPKEADAAHIVSFSPQTALELIRLARLGKWAEEVGIETIEISDCYCDGDGRCERCAVLARLPKGWDEKEGQDG